MEILFGAVFFNQRDEFLGRSVRETTDGGFICVGNVYNDTTLASDFLIMKTDENGNLQWCRTYGTGGLDVCYSVEQTFDGGYILAGRGKHDWCGRI